MNMKRAAAWLMALILLLGLGMAQGEDFEADEGTEEAAEEGYLYSGPEYDPKRLVVGNPTPLSGNFTTQMWGGNTSDLDVMALVNGYNLIYWDQAKGTFAPDPTVVTSMSVIEKDDSGSSDLVEGDESGNRTYVMTLNEAMKYSDGTPITAADYAFSILLSTAPAVKSLGGDTENYRAIFGVEEYRDGTRTEIAGVRILNEHTLSLTVKKENLPFFYELGYLRCYPMPAHSIAPGCSIVDDGQGAYIDGIFNSALLEKTLLDPSYGYVSHPFVISGPYKLTSYDAESHTAEFEINPAYLGNYEGQKPSIRFLTLKTADNGTMIQELEEGSYGLLNKVMKAGTIESGVALVQGRNYAMTSYARSGMSMISLSCELGAMGDETVRQAIALCLDKEATVQRYCGSYGLRADGYYGAGQWMVQMLTGALTPPEDGNAGAWSALKMDGIRKYDLNVAEAVRLLEADGWTLNEDGEAFDPEWDDFRCRETDGKLEKLDFTLVLPVGNEMEGILQETFLPHLMEAGIRVTELAVNWDSLLREYYRLDRRSSHMLYLGTNFSEVFDPRAQFNPEDAKKGHRNYNGISDDELYRLASELAATAPGDLLGYETRWLDFQKHYQEIVPAIPVYTNMYFDFHTRWLQNYHVTEHRTWTEAILYAYMSDPTVPEEDEV